MNEKLRPLTLGEILDRTAQLYRRDFWTLVGVAAVPMIAMFAVALPFGDGWVGVFRAGHAVSNTVASLGLITLAVVIAFPVLLAATVVSQVSLTKTAIDAQMGQKMKVREAIKSVWPRFWRYLWLIVLLGLLVGGVPAAIATSAIVGAALLTKGGGDGGSTLFGFFMFAVIAAAFVFAIWQLLCYSMAISACIVEEKTGWQSIKRANLLSKGTRGRIFVMYLLVFAISMVISIIANVFTLIVVAMLPGAAGAKFGGVATGVALSLALLSRLTLQILIQPIAAIALVLFYYDQRVRKEGYDIELMMEDAGLTTPPVTPSSPVGPALPEEPQLTPVPEGPLMPTFEPGPSPDTVKE